MFIRREDAPFAKNRATAPQVQLANEAVGPNGAKIWENPTITKVRVMGYYSPFVWKSQRFFEIENPVKKRAGVSGPT